MFISKLKQKLLLYAQLIRLHKPIGILLLLWPCLWALWIAGAGKPSLKNVIIFIAGVILMRSAGCAINDYADRAIDGRVMRTQHRPLAANKIKPYEAVMVFIMLSVCAFGLVLFLNFYALALSVVAVLLAFIYPFSKRVTQLPQFILGLAFSWGIPMAFAAERGEIPLTAWLLFTTAVVWTIIYDTFYAMADRADDVKIGVKSTAILFGKYDRLITGLLQLIMVGLLIILGGTLNLSWSYYLALVLVAILFSYQQYLIKDRERSQCFAAFINNNWVGLIIFLSLAIQYF